MRFWFSRENICGHLAVVAPILWIRLTLQNQKHIKKIMRKNELKTLTFEFCIWYFHFYQYLSSVFVPILPAATKYVL